MIKRTLSVILILLFALSLLTACGDNRSASQILQDALKKNSEVTSQSFSGFIELSANFDDLALQSMGPDAALALQYLKNLRISYEGAYTVKPMEGEILLSTEIPIGDLKTKIDLPILMKEDKIWVKVPQLPVPELQGFAGKYIEIDIKELEKLSGSELTIDPANMEENQKIANQLYHEELFPLFFKTYGEKYVKKVDLKNVEVPQNIKAQQSVEFTVTQEQMDAFITSLLNDFLPKAIDIFAKEEYRKITNLTKDQVEQSKKDLETAKTEWEKNKREFNKVVKNSIIQFIGVVDQSGYLAHSIFNLSGDITPQDQQGTMSLKVTVQSSMFNVNQKQTLKNTIPPASEEVIPFQDLMNGLIGGGL